MLTCRIYLCIPVCTCVCRCDCQSGYTGKNCSENVDDCASHACQNGATCEDGVSSYRCVCSRGYAGRFCEIAPVPGAIEYYFGGVCQNHDCKNGGLCVQPPGSPEYICKCPPGGTCSSSYFSIPISRDVARNLICGGIRFN